MQIDDMEIKERLTWAFGLTDEVARAEAVREAMNAMVDGKAPWADGRMTVVQRLPLETSDRVIAVTWNRLRALPPDEELRSMALRELESPVRQRRYEALKYLAELYPDDRLQLYDRMQNDPDAYVLCELGWIILPLSREKALDVWVKGIKVGTWDISDEQLPLQVGMFADPQFLAYWEQIAERDLGDDVARLITWQAAPWNAVEYVEHPEGVPLVAGHLINCPHCGKRLGIRDGHVGEEIRCRACQTSFVAFDGSDRA